jgi:hypothetical protein
LFLCYITGKAPAGKMQMDGGILSAGNHFTCMSSTWAVQSRRSTTWGTQRLAPTAATSHGPEQAGSSHSIPAGSKKSISDSVSGEQAFPEAGAMLQASDFLSLKSHSITSAAPYGSRWRVVESHCRKEHGMKDILWTNLENAIYLIGANLHSLLLYVYFGRTFF